VLFCQIVLGVCLSVCVIIRPKDIWESRTTTRKRRDIHRARLCVCLHRDVRAKVSDVFGGGVAMLSSGVCVPLSPHSRDDVM